MPDIGASMLARGLSELIMHGQCRGIDGLYVLQPGHVHAVGGWCKDSRFDVTGKNLTSCKCICKSGRCVGRVAGLL